MTADSLRRARCSLLFLLSALVFTADAQASETVFYRESPWEIALVADDEGSANPYCALRTTIWQNQSVSFEATLTGLDKVEESVHLHKKDWQLPVGASTEVNVTTMAPPVLGQEYAPIPFKAATAQDLFAQLVFQPEEPIVMLFMVFGGGQAAVFPHQATFRFKGNEPDWVVPTTSSSAYPALSQAFQECRVELNKQGHRLFSSVESNETSPFATEQDTSNRVNAVNPSETGYGAERDQMTGEPNHSSDGVAAEHWTFTHHEEDWGNVCVVEVAHDKFQIGFMGTPGLEKIAYIEGLDVQSANAVWQVDANEAYPLRGTRSDYFGFLAFDIPSPNFIEELMEGSTFKISVIGKAKISLGVSSSRDAFAKFVQCHSDNGAASSTAVE